MFKKLIKHSAIYGLSPQLIKLANIVALPIITADLTSSDFGIFGIISAYMAAISIFSTLGLRVVVVNAFYHYSGHYLWLWRQLYGFLRFWNFPYAVLSGLLLWFIIPDEALGHRIYIIILQVLPITLFGPAKFLGSTYYQVKQKPTPIAIRTAIFGFLTVILNVYFISYLKLGYMGWFTANFIVGIAHNASYFYFLNFKLGCKPIFNFKWYRIKKSLKVSLPTVPHFYSSYLLNSSDRMVMDTLNISADNIGKYSVAYTVSGLMSSISQAVAQALGPILNNLYKTKKDESARYLLNMMQVGFFIISGLACIWLKEIFQLLIRNDDLALMYPLGIIILMSYNYRPMYFASNSKLMFSERTGVLWKITFVAGLINVILNFIFIPIYGYKVAAYTTFICLMYMGYGGFFTKAYRSVSFVSYNPLLWLVITIILTFTNYWLVELFFLEKVLASIIYIVFGVWTIFYFKRVYDQLKKV